ncbi:MAG: ATP-binding cassette domain-containing protein [Actinobacteria bacterium]|uniref:Unannotated protein n=1 Tax=freshwater metagenome TaxID=449393 RepID=A0A6J7RES6_9ZZZZ|nr:ATP-binding cassette domain-containing protein [Actinomycetota bacterium]
MTLRLLSIHTLTITVPATEPKGPRRTVVDRVDLHVERGESLGLVGESGSGKSMTARAVLGLFASGVKATGRIEFDGSDVLTMGEAQLQRVRASRIAMVFQDPRAHINPVRSVGDFMTEGMRDSGVSRVEAGRRAIALLAEVGIDDGDRRLAQFPHELSGGLLQRVMIAAALAMRPDLLLADEPTTALDVTTQSEVMAILAEVRRERGLAMLFITHDLELAAATCDRTAVMYAGRIMEVQRSTSLQHAPLHPYTSGLLVSRPDIDVVQRRLQVIPGRSVAAFEAPTGCAFEPRCSYAQADCRAGEPELVLLGSAEVRCGRVDELRGTLPHTVGGPDA